MAARIRKIDKERQRVCDRREYFDIDEISGQTIGAVATHFSMLAYQFEEQIDKGFELRFESESYGYDGGREFYIAFYRDENDKEYSARLKREQAAAEKAARIREAKREKARKELYRKEADERAEYDRLRAKYENL